MPIRGAISVSAGLPCPVLSPLPSGQWRLVKSYWCAGWFVPAGFVCDLDSVPRIPILFLWLKNRTVVGALMHDYLLSLGVNPFRASLFFLRVMKLEKVSRRYRWPLFWGTFLWSFWILAQKFFNFSVDDSRRHLR